MAVRADAGPDPSSSGRKYLEAAREQLETYFSGKLHTFTVPLDLSRCTLFQRRVLQCCSAVPYGGTASYGELALRAGYPRAARAVGQAMAGNPLALIVPCHRVIGSDGRLTGYGHGLALKEQLMALERGHLSWSEVSWGMDTGAADRASSAR